MSFSQNISENNKIDSVLITSEQLKYTNLIFVEHEKLLIENDLLYQEIDSYEYELETWRNQDSIRLNELNTYAQLTDNQNLQILNLNKELNKNKKFITGLKVGCITVSVAVVLLLIFK